MGASLPGTARTSPSEQGLNACLQTCKMNHLLLHATSLVSSHEIIYWSGIVIIINHYSRQPVAEAIQRSRGAGSRWPLQTGAIQGQSTHQYPNVICRFTFQATCFQQATT